MDYIEYELNKLYANEAYNDKIMTILQQACIDYDDYLRGLHEDCEVV